jgi:hypothetical protein
MSLAELALERFNHLRGLDIGAAAWRGNSQEQAPDGQCTARRAAKTPQSISSHGYLLLSFKRFAG